MDFELKKWIKVNSNGELVAADGASGVSISADKKVATIPGFGTVDISKGKDKAVIRLSVDFNDTITWGTSEVTSVTGVEALYGATNGKLTYKATTEGKIVGGSGADSIILGASTASIDLGAGNDVVSLGTGTSNVTLGSGADLIQVKAEAAAYGKVADYNFAEGDAISLDVALAADKVSVMADTGEVSLSGGDNLKIMSTKNDGVYAAKFTEGSIGGLPGDVTYFTAAQGSGKVNIDASRSEIAVIDAKNSTGANIVSGAGADSISLGGNGADTIVIGKSSGADKVYNFGTNDVLRFVGGSINDLSYDGTTRVVTFADSTVSLSSAAAGSLTANIAFGDADAESVALANQAGATLQQADAVKGYVGFSDGSTVLEVSKSVDLTDTAHFANIANVKVNGNTEAATVIGALKSVDASNAGKTVNVWSTEKDANIKLETTGNNADTVWIGSGSTEVKLSGFETGFDATADTLVLYDVSDVKDISVNGNVVTAGSAKIEMTDITDSIAANVVLKGGVAKKIVISNDDVELDKDSLDLDVLSTSKKNATLNVAANVTDGGKNVVSINLNDEKYADSFKNVSSKSNAGTTNIIGSATVEGATIKVTDKGDHNIWAANTGANTIEFTAAATGKNSVWYNAIDGKDTVSGFTKNDTVLLYGGEMVGSSAINSAYKITYDGTVVKFASGDSALALKDLNAGDTFTVMDNAGDTYKVQLANTGKKLTYDKDTKFYVASSDATTLDVVGYDASETAALVVNGDANGNIITGNVTKIDAGASSVKTLLVGSAEAATELVGGKTENHFWGGSKDSDVMVGNSAAFDDFWFGKLDGKDTANSVNADDRVYLYDVNSADINTIAKLSIDASNASADLSLEGGAILGINASSVSDFDSIVFRTGDGVDFTYDKKSKTFVKKS